MSQTDLELAALRTRLADDAGGQELSALTTRLTEARAGLTRKLDEGVSSSEFDELSSMKDAYDAGLELLPKLWDAFNTRN